jgi:glycosyltransferase involved in cell wall biosynthesis
MKLSVVMAARNSVLHLPAALQSIREQTVRDFELVVVNDGSTDETAAVLADAAAADSRITVLQQEHRGLTESLNRGIAASTGEFIARHDADDVSLPSRFERQLTYFQDHPGAAAVGTAAMAFDDGGRDIGPLTNRTGPRSVHDGMLSLAATPVHGSMMIRRTAVDAVGAYRIAFRAAQDLDLWLRLTERGDVDNVPECLYRWRAHPSGVYATRRAVQLMYAGIAVLFARERALTGGDSYALLDSCGGDLNRFAAEYRMRGPLQALWGELLFRGLNDPKLARPHLRTAIREGEYRLRTLALYGWSALGLSWPGGRQLAAPSLSL